MDEIESILCKVLDCSRTGLYLERDRSPLDSFQEKKLDRILKKRGEGEPLGYLLGDVDFMGLVLSIDESVLIPRPETEFLVEEALKVLAHRSDRLILDMCTGSGNIALALAAFLPGVRVSAVDVSGRALEVALANARRLGLSEKIEFLESDLFACFESGLQAFDAIISNPPYIAEEEYEDLPSDVKREPRLALLSTSDGFYFYHKIEEGARRHLKPGGVVFLEIGESQGAGVEKIFADSSHWESARVIQDLCGKDRVVVVTKKFVS